MITKSTTVVNPTGLHARPAAVLATKAGEFSSKVEIKNLSKDSDYKDASSMLSIMMLSQIERNPRAPSLYSIALSTM